MNVLVAGGPGYAGSQFGRLLADQEIPGAVVDDLSAGHADALPKSVPLIRVR